MRIKDLISRSKALIEGNVYLAVDDATNNVTQKVDYKTLAQEIIEQYNLSTLAGSAQSVKAALDGVNNNLIVPNNRIVILNNSDINTYTTPGVYAVPSDASASTMTNLPRNASGKLIVMVRGNNPAYLQQKYITSSSAYIEYVRNYNNGTWTAWEQLPTRAEIDALNSKTIYNPTALSQIGTVLQYLNSLPNGARAYAHTWAVVSDMPSGLSDASYNFQFVTDAANRSYDYVILTKVGTAEQWYGKVSSNNLTTRTLSWIKLPTRAEVDKLNSKNAWISSTQGWVTIAPNKSKTFNVPNVSKAILLTMQGTSADNFGMYFVNATGQGAITTKAVSGESNITITTEANKMTLTTANSASNSYVTFLTFGGTGITEA